MRNGLTTTAATLIENYISKRKKYLKHCFRTAFVLPVFSLFFLFGLVVNNVIKLFFLGPVKFQKKYEYMNLKPMSPSGLLNLLTAFGPQTIVYIIYVILFFGQLALFFNILPGLLLVVLLLVLCTFV